MKTTLRMTALGVMVSSSNLSFPTTLNSAQQIEQMNSQIQGQLKDLQAQIYQFNQQTQEKMQKIVTSFQQEITQLQKNNPSSRPC